MLLSPRQSKFLSCDDAAAHLLRLQRRLTCVPTVHSIEAIEALLRRGITPKTDNESALRELGFERTSPTARGGYDATLWERSRDHAGEAVAGAGRRLLVRERAVLEIVEPASVVEASVDESV